MREATYEEYVRAIEKVLRYVQQSLDDQIDVNALADVAGYSPFHFQRSFHRLVGEAPITYVRRMRLERAAYQLRNTKESISSIAADTTLGSLAAFTRSFERSFGAPPSQYRKLPWASHWQASPIGVHYEPTSELQFKPLARRGTPSSARIEKVPSIHVLAMRHDGPIQFMHTTWKRFLRELEDLGINPAAHQALRFTHTPRQPSETWKIRGYVGIVTNIAVPEGSDIQPHIIGNGYYLVKRHTGSPRLLADFWSRAWLEDLYELRVRQRYAPAFNMIVKGNDAPLEEHITDIYLPIVPPLGST